MSVVSHVVTTSPQSATRMNVVYTFTDHISGETVVTKLVPYAFDTEADALSLYAQVEQQLADTEISEAIAVAEAYGNPETFPFHQTQADFDRRLLGRLMTYLDAHVVYAGLPFFQGVEIRGGANSIQRAAYLGVSSQDYSLVDSRFGDVQGIAFFLDDDKDQVWDDPLDGWE
jgi:hypothetical protein